MQNRSIVISLKSLIISVKNEVEIFNKYRLIELVSRFCFLIASFLESIS